MTKTYALPQPLTGAETVTIRQTQNGQAVECTMPLSQLATILSIGNSTAWVAGLPTVLPTTPGVVWNNNGAVSISS